MRAGEGHRQIVRAEVHAGGAGGERDVGPVVHQHGNRQRRHQRARAARPARAADACLSRSCTERHAARLGGAGQRDEVAARPPARSSVTSISRTNAATLGAMTTPTPRLQGIRGATTVSRNDAAEILAATDELLRALDRGQRARARTTS